MFTTKVDNNLWFYYWQAVSLVIELIIPLAIAVCCLLLTVWRMLKAHKRRASLVKVSSTVGGARGTTRNTKVLLLFTLCYVLIGVPNIILYLIISLPTISCVVNFMVILAGDLFTSACRFSLFTRIFDCLVFLVIPEFRAALLNILHCNFHTQAF